MGAAREFRLLWMALLDCCGWCLLAVPLTPSKHTAVHICLLQS